MDQVQRNKAAAKARKRYHDSKLQRWKHIVSYVENGADSVELKRSTDAIDALCLLTHYDDWHAVCATLPNSDGESVAAAAKAFVDAIDTRCSENNATQRRLTVADRKRQKLDNEVRDQQQRCQGLTKAGVQCQIRATMKHRQAEPLRNGGRLCAHHENNIDVSGVICCIGTCMNGKQCSVTSACSYGPQNGSRYCHQHLWQGWAPPPECTGKDGNCAAVTNDGLDENALGLDNEFCDACKLSWHKVGGWCSVEDEELWYNERKLVKYVRCSATKPNGGICGITSLHTHDGAEPLRNGDNCCALHGGKVYGKPTMSKEDLIAGQETARDIVCGVPGGRLTDPDYVLLPPTSGMAKPANGLAFHSTIENQAWLNMASYKLKGGHAGDPDPLSGITDPDTERRTAPDGHQYTKEQFEAFFVDNGATWSMSVALPSTANDDAPEDDALEGDPDHYTVSSDVEFDTIPEYDSEGCRNW